MKSMKRKTITILLGSLFFSSCTNDSENDLIEIPIQQTVTYTNFAKGVIDSNCIICHGDTPSNGAPMSLNTYSSVKDAILNRGLLDRISRAQGADGLMPLGGSRLPQTTIDNMVQWQSDGLLE